MKKVARFGAVAICLTLALTVLAACNGKTMRVGMEHVDVYTYVGNTMSPKLTNTGTNKVTESDNHIRVDVAKNVTDIEFEVSRFFETNKKYLGKKFYFTRDDVKKGDNTLIKGSAWVEVTGGGASTRLYKKLGYHTDATVTAMTKTQIEALPNREGEVRMYILTQGLEKDKHLVYIDPTTGSTVEAGETRVTFRFHGHHGKTAEMKVLVNKATA